MELLLHLIFLLFYMTEDLKTFLQYILPTLLAFGLWFGQRFFNRKDSMDSSYVDSRFEFTAKSESKLWDEIYVLRKDVALLRQENLDLLLKYIDALIESNQTDKLSEARSELRAKLRKAHLEEAKKVSDVSGKVLDHKQTYRKQFAQDDEQLE